MHVSRGFTLINLLLGLVILSIVLALAAPSVVRASARIRMGNVAASMTETFLASTRLAVTTGSAMVVCPATESGDCQEGMDWSRGWLVYADIDGNRRYGGPDNVVHRAAPPTGGLRLYSTQGRERLVFQTDGGNEGSNASFTVCSPEVGEVGVLVLSNAGRFRFAEHGEPLGRPCP